MNALDFEVVTGFTGETEVDMPLPCSYDMEVAGTKYLNLAFERLVKEAGA